MKYFLLSLCMAPFAMSFYSCHPTGIDNTPVGDWVQRSEFDGVPRSEAVAMVIGDTAYIGTGYDGRNYLKDCWKYDAMNNYWLQRADLPGDGRQSAITFAIGTRGYLGTGYNGRQNLKDFWEFNPAANQWTPKTDFAGSARYDAVGFAINGKGYISTGFDGNAQKDLYEYDPGSDTAGATSSPWILRPPMGGTKRSAAIVFVFDNKAYICSGVNNGRADYVNDMWMYDPVTVHWTAKNAIANVSAKGYDDSYAIVRYNAAAFVMNGRGYLSCGENGSLMKDTWEYDFGADQWTKKTDYEGMERTGATGFGVLNRGFLMAGRNSTLPLDDIMEFLPNDLFKANN